MNPIVLLNPAGRRRRVKANPKRRTRRRARARNPMPAVIHRRVMANPRRRRARHRNPIRAYHRRRRNPIGNDFMGLAGLMLKEAALGAVGSAGMNAIMSFVQPSLPTSMGSGMSYSAVKALATIGMGMLAKKMGPSGVMMAQGALTVQLALLLKTQLGTSLPTDGALASLRYYTSGVQVPGGAGSQMLPRLQGLRGARSGGMGAYVGAGSLTGLGGDVSEMQGTCFS